MLEQSSLLLRPWALSPRRLAIVAPGSDAPMGFACWRGVHRWWGWLTRPVLEIRECEDEPLLMVMYRGWGWRSNWEVSDAEGTTVGYVHGTALLSEFGDELGQWRWTNRPDKALVVRARQAVLARAERQADGVLLTFDPLTHSPFARMILLAVTLAHMLL
jgi:hypothetical protein